MEVVNNDWDSDETQTTCENDSDVTDSEDCNSDSSDSDVDDDDAYFIEPFSPLKSGADTAEIYRDTSNNRNNNSNNNNNNNTLAGTESSPIDSKSLIKQKLKEFRRNFEGFCVQIPVLGYNSAKYDPNLIKEKLVKHLGMHLKNNGKKFVIKKKQRVHVHCQPHPEISWHVSLSSSKYIIR